MSLTCREVSEFLAEFFGDGLPDEVRIDFTTHLDGCANCQVFILQYRETILAGQMACRDEGVAGCPEELVRAVLDALQREIKA